MSKDAGLGVLYTNHSLTATSITRMYEGGVPENLISEKSGHRSLKGLRSYERTSVSLEKAEGASIAASTTTVLTTTPNSVPTTIVKEETKDEPRKGAGVLPNFSGLQNCT